MNDCVINQVIGHAPKTHVRTWMYMYKYKYTVAMYVFLARVYKEGEYQTAYIAAWNSCNDIHMWRSLWNVLALVHTWLAWAVMFVRVTSKHEYQYKGYEPYEQLLHIAICAVQHSPSSSLYTLAFS